ncbi:hypothetical protein PGUG_00742 [Meyerozyma guilliermondii ATCC 6260]|uniref:Uncharacterized protein n=1 Tax=Meyerozyma guilliermondii (strain ATCC 6260 / CBS 566 / DSM 6381 / JCM 1539 / NBRC 10279 / NRRL Y-324) TaxID=294746 RepID=A5DBT7_PICGU|nr:uncharacterized protein PGUG_00742 [Meyerozyma guilliermondii ATCC 6260]EDK36644.2 hypothetical protein PGUG_00742 [Meyerozyma guilliermondii ATCC 6260]
MSDKEEERETETQDDELSKEDRLEAARKKFEEMKKKKKKGKKKKKDDDKADSPTPDAVETEDKDVAVKEANSESASLDAPKETESQGSEPKVDLPSVSDTVQNADNKQAAISMSDDKTNTESADPSSEVPSLKATIEQQKATINKLRDEITDLKLDRMDLKDKINELEKKLAAGGTAKLPETPKYYPAKPVITTNKFASASKEDINAVTTDDFRERLLAWKGWQVDMTPWTNGQKISL